MADTEVFATLDSVAAPVGWDYSPHLFPTVDAAAAVVPMVSGAGSSQSVEFATFARKAQPGRWRTTEG